MRQDFSFVINTPTGEYTPAGAAGSGAALTDFRFWHPDTFRIYDTAIGSSDEQFLAKWDYEVFRNTYRYAQQTPGRPAVFAIRPRDKALMFGPVPEKQYTVSGEYQQKAVTLSVDGDTPAIDDELHMVIVYEAMLSYGLDQSAAEVIARAQRELRVLIPQLRSQYLPAIQLGAPMA